MRIYSGIWVKINQGGDGMYLTKLKLQNFKCFENIEIDFHENLTVIAGSNGAGKTTILEGAAIALSTMFMPIDGASSKGIDQSQVRISGNNFEYEEGKNFPVNVIADAVDMGTVVHWARSLNTAKSSTTYGAAKEMIELSNRYLEQLTYEESDVILPMIAYYGTGRMWDYHREKQNDIFGTSKRINGYVDSMDGVANIKLMMNWFMKTTILKYQNLEVGLGPVPTLNAVCNAMEECYKRITNCNDVKIQYSMQRKELFINTEDAQGNKMRLPVNQLSDGYKCTISLVADIAYRMAVLNPHLGDDICAKTPGIVLIDEIDLHLHPTWQQTVLRDLRDIFPMVQFIVTTHAPAVVNTVAREHVRILRNFAIDTPVVETYGRDSNGILTTIMDTKHRPESVLEEFQQFYTAIDDGKFDDADSILANLEEKYSDDPEVIAMRVQFDLEQM